ncbi:MAG: class I SAM-dependent methyltransferase [Methanoregula sp.]|jgi:ubiquinone/menaquinone biosynthesis C-methylase UbiE|nr:class I SAM-dependent methyltransferase [Methanoregula sp.]
MPDTRIAWERDYSARGRLWVPSVHTIPDLAAGACVLEMGCGSKTILGTVLNRPWDVVAFDFSEKAAMLSRRFADGNNRVDSIVSDARRLPFRDERFDAVIAFHVIGHMPEYDRKLSSSEAARVLKTGGSLLFRDFSINDFRYGKGDEIECNTFRRGTGIITHYFKEPEVTDLFCVLHPVSLISRRWTMKVRGNNLLREDVDAVFLKEQ